MKRLLPALLGLAVACCGLPAAAPAAAELRVVVDVSGSMKETDPRNLRVPAVQLLAALMPADARGGLWTFGQKTERLVAPATVDARWRKAFDAAAARIHSRAAWTDIEDALAGATADWEGPPADGERRELLLLTDGVVDVSAGTEASAASRARLLDALAPALRARGIHVHTVALSSAADAALLAAIAETTDGLPLVVEDAEQLERAFLRLFETAAPRDALPLEAGGIEVDASVRELTLLVFRAPGASPTRLVAPDGTVIDASSRTAGVQWRSTPTRDLVTIDAPAAGRWRLDAEADPDNRALVVTDLALDFTPPPRHLLRGEKLALDLGLTERGEPIVRGDFLELLDATLDGGRGRRAPFVLDAGAGRFGLTALPDDWPVGRHRVRLVVDGGTFRRERRFEFELHASPLHVEAGGSLPEDPAHEFHVEVRPEVVVRKGLKLRAWLEDGSDGRTPLEAQADPAGGWQIVIPKTAGEPRRLVLAASGRTRAGRPFSTTLPPIELEPLPTPEATAPLPAPAAAPEINWLAVALQVGLAHLLVGPLAWLGWRRLRPLFRVAPLPAEGVPHVAH